VKAVKKFKGLLGPGRAEPPMQSILGQEYEGRFVEPPMEMDPEESVSLPSMTSSNKSQSLNTYNRKALERDYVLKGYHQQKPGAPNSSLGNSDSPVGITGLWTKPEKKESGSNWSLKMKDESVGDENSPSPQVPLSRASSTTTKRSIEGTRGHARDPLEEDCPFLFIGPSTFTGSNISDPSNTDGPSMILEPDDSANPGADQSDLSYPMVSESPGAADFDIYETAYRQEVERIRAHTTTRAVPMVYLTRRVDGKDELMKLVRETTMSEPALGIGRKVTIPQTQSFGSAVGIIRAQLELDRKKQEQAAQGEDQDQGQSRESSTVGPSQPVTASSPPLTVTPSPEEPTTSTTSVVVSGTTIASESSSPEGQRSRLRNLLGRVKHS
jgi:[calcium/calmodulin-dependent protein kinase] kinase